MNPRSNAARLAAAVAAIALIAGACGGDADTPGSTAPAPSEAVTTTVPTTMAPTTAATSGRDVEYVDAVTAAMWRNMQEDGDLPDGIDEETARCVATSTVEIVGVDQLEAAGITLEALEGDLDDLEDPFDLVDSAQAEALADEFFDCVDLVGLMAAEMAADGISIESAECMSSALFEESGFRDAMVRGLVSSDDDDVTFDEPAMASALFGAMNECLTEEELAVMMGGS